MKNKSTTDLQHSKKIKEKLEALEQKLFEAEEKARRSLADYQNLQRRTQDERLKMIKFANRELVESLLPILENLEKAAQQVEDQGLAMILTDLQQVLEQAGLEEIKVMGQEFDLNTMEAVEKNGEGEEVVEVLKKGYKLNGEVIQHAKVVLG